MTVLLGGGRTDRRPVLVRMARRGRPVVADLWTGGLDLCGKRVDEEAADERERRQNRG